MFNFKDIKKKNKTVNKINFKMINNMKKDINSLNNDLNFNLKQMKKLNNNKFSLNKYKYKDNYPSTQKVSFEKKTKFFELINKYKKKNRIIRFSSKIYIKKNNNYRNLNINKNKKIKNYIDLDKMEYKLRKKIGNIKNRIKNLTTNKVNKIKVKKKTQFDIVKNNKNWYESVLNK